MSEYKMNLTGWQAIVVIVVFIGIFGVRLMTFNDKTGDKDLMKHIDTQLMMEYAPHVAGKLRAALDSDDKVEMDKGVESVLTTKVNIDSVQASYPLFDFSIPKEVVIKVAFSLDDAAGTSDKRTIYYLFKKSAFGWHYEYITTAVSYYLNFV